jgi:16S rRNA processing protein RimM
MTETHLVVGYVAGVHGIRGGVRMRLHDERSDAITVGREVQLWREGRLVCRSHVTAASAIPGKPASLRVQLRDVATRGDAEALRGCEVRVDRDALAPLSDDEFYLVDTIGAHVIEVDGAHERDLGEVVGLSSNGVQDLLEVEWIAPDGATHAWLLPVLPQFIVEIDPPRVIVDVPPGMLPDALEARR